MTRLDAEFLNYEEQLEIMNTINAHSQLQKEINKCKAERVAMERLQYEMDLQHRQWIAEVKRIHKKERTEIMNKIKFMQEMCDAATAQWCGNMPKYTAMYYPNVFQCISFSTITNVSYMYL